MKKLKVLDLFSGIGGFSLGFENTEFFETVAFCEIDKHCHAVLNKNFPNVPIFEDVKSLKAEDVGEVDVIVGGFPCQDISTAGRQKGINENTRSGLWIEYKRIIEEVKPRWVVIENVRNLLSNGLAIVLQDLHEIGYDAEWEIISARAVGACHLRERAWIVAYPSSERRQQIPRSPHGYEEKNEGRREGFYNLVERNGQSNRPKQISRQVAEDTTHTRSERLERQRDSGHPSGAATHGEGEANNIKHGSRGEEFHTTNSDDFRFWPSFASEEAKQEWWAETTASFSDWWEVTSTVRRVDDGLSRGVDRGREKARRERIKQLGNSIVPFIAQIIAERIKHHETNNLL